MITWWPITVKQASAWYHGQLTCILCSFSRINSLNLSYLFQLNGSVVWMYPLFKSQLSSQGETHMAISRGIFGCQSLEVNGYRPLMIWTDMWPKPLIRRIKFLPYHLDCPVCYAQLGGTKLQLNRFTILFYCEYVSWENGEASILKEKNSLPLCSNLQK